jgi:hypothetical protein
MEYVLLIGMFLILFKLYKPVTVPRQVSSASAKLSIESPALSGHTLIRVWNRDDVSHRKRGWWYECSCGRQQPGSAVDEWTRGSEADALKTFKKHAGLYQEFTIEAVNPLKVELEKERKTFAEYRKKCYCKETNDDLILMKGEHKWE